jgi:general secretion pathway protein A
MYEKFFYLKEKPFHITPDPKFLYAGKKHGAAIDLLRYGIDERKGFIMLTGEVGTGKTTLCRALLDKLSRKTETALILNPVLSRQELLTTIAEDFGIDAKGFTLKECLDAINRMLLNASAGGRNAVLIIDEAQVVGLDTLEMIRLLSNLETEKTKLLQIVLVGQPELKEKLKLPELRQLNQRITVRYELTPLDLNETRDYISNRLKVAGAGDAVRFEDASVRLIHAGSKGIPRMINIICDRSLTAAFVAGKMAVDIDCAGRAIDELKSDGVIPAPLRGHEGADCVVPPNPHVPDCPTVPYYMKLAPHIALSAFLLSVVAGIFLGPAILDLTIKGGP